MNKKIAVFVNTEYLVEKDKLKKRLCDYASFADVFFSEKGSEDLFSLCSGVNASYKDYDYILLINPQEEGEHEEKRIYVSRQNYYIFGFLSDKDTLVNAIEIMEENSKIGLLTLPVDYLQAGNWEHYENWADYYRLVLKWLRKNKINVSTSIDKPPVLGTGTCLIKCSAIQDFADLNFKIYDNEFVNYIISILCQHNGFLPHYVMPKNLLLNNYFGYEGLMGWQQEMVKVKDKYYSQLTKYKKEKIDYLEAAHNDMLHSTSWRITAPIRALKKFFSHIFKR